MKQDCTNPLFVIIASAIFALVSCTSPLQNAGNGSGVGNGIVVGKLYQPDGRTPARGIRVTIRPKNSLADTTGAGLMKMSAKLAETDSVVTDSAGRFAFDSTLDTGSYAIEAASGNNAVFIDSIIIKNKDSTDTLAPDTLKPAGAIKGIIRLSEGGDPRKAFVLAFGIDRFAHVNADGSFKFSSLAEGKYDLRLVSSLDNYGVLDTVNIPVKSGDTLDMGTIDLPFTGIPTPKNVTIAYDTLKQIVGLSWSKTSPTLVNGYYVYRRNVDSNTLLTRINTSPITDTLYRDSTGIQDQTYEYRVSAIDKNVTEGTKSAGVSVKVVGAFVVFDSLGSFGTAVGQFTDVWDMACDKNKNLYIVSCENNTGDNPKVQKFDSRKNNILSFGLKGSDSLQFLLPKGIAIDQRERIYVTDRGNARVQIFDSTGAFVRSIYGQTSDSSRLLDPKEIAVDDSALYIGDYSNSEYYSSVKKFDLNGKFLQKWGAKGNAPGQFIMIWAMKVTSKGNLAILDENGIQFFSKQGTFIKRITKDTFGIIKDFDIVDKLIYSVTYEGKVIILDESGIFIGKYNSKKTDLFQVTSNGSNVFLHYFESGKITVLQQRN